MDETGGVILKTALSGLKLVRRGKVRDIYEAGDHLLMVVSDRLSAFDVVLPDGIPGKGRVLTAISVFWFNRLEGIIKNHLVTADVEKMPPECRAHAGIIAGRSMLVRKAAPLPVECIVRGYITGSGWKDYRESGSVCGIKLPAGLRESDRLPEPIFTPSTKSERGHDENISFAEAVRIAGAETAGKIKELSLSLYKEAAAYAEKKGIIIADTKFEFGLFDGGLILIDEVLTPDSSRFWSRRDWAPAKSQDSFDKQIVRDYLSALDWNKTWPGPSLPAEIIAGTSGRYREILGILTGAACAPGAAGNR